MINKFIPPLVALGIFSSVVGGQSTRPPTRPAPVTNVLKNQPKDQISTREMNRINWMEFKQMVPSQISTVLLPTGTLEPHGVINNGADNTAPTAIAHKIAVRVNALIATGLILFIITLIINSLARLVVNRRKEFSGAN